MKITFDTRELKSLVRKKARQSNKNLMRVIAGDLQDEAEDNFQTNGQGKWPKLAKSTVAQKRRRGRNPNNILRDKGQLVSSISTRHTNNRAIVGTNKVYAAIHQFGGNISRASRSETFKRNRYKRGRKKGRFKKGTSTGQGFTFNSYSTKIPAREFLTLRKNLTLVKKRIIDFYSV